MEHYNSVAGAMTRSLWCEPIYEIDPNSDEVLWEPWVDGFTRAMRLRPDAWEALLDRADEETRSSMIFLMVLQDINLGESKFTDGEIDEIDIEAPDLIPNCVATILTQSRPELAQTAAANLPGSPYAAPRKTRPQRSLRLRLGPEIQDVLRPALKRLSPFAQVFLHPEILETQEHLRIRRNNAAGCEAPGESGRSITMHNGVVVAPAHVVRSPERTFTQRTAWQHAFNAQQLCKSIWVTLFRNECRLGNLGRSLGACRHS